MQTHQEPDGHPERWSQNHVGIIKKQQDLKQGRCEVSLLAISHVSGQVAHEALVEPVVEVLRLDPDLEDQIIGRGRVRPKSVPVLLKSA